MKSYENALEKEYEEYLLYLYDLAAYKYGDCSDIDSLVQETLIALLIKQKNETVEHPKGFLSAVLKNKHNEWLRKRYRNNIISFDMMEPIEEGNDDFKKIEEDMLRTEEYAAVRREIGRLVSIYREVTVRYYVHGHSIEKIAHDLGISAGTVKSRLSSARDQIREGISNMEKYSEVSYSPKRLSIAIWGNEGISGEPFSFIGTQIEQNILILAYESPVSIRSIADAMGIPSAFIEPLVDRLIRGELMGKTSGGLVFTRCFIVGYDDSFGDIQAQEAVAKKYAKAVWDIAEEHFAALFKHEEFLSMNEKQKATLCLFGLDMALANISNECEDNTFQPSAPPERSNGGRWFAYGTIYDNTRVRDIKYDASGPVTVNYWSETDRNFGCRLQDKQSFFGSAHWAYNTFKYKCRLQTIARFYASLIPDCSIKPDDERIYELIPDFEGLNIIKRDENGKAMLDIPYLTEETTQTMFYPATTRIYKDVLEIVKPELVNLCASKRHRVPKHVDGHKFLETQWLLRAYPLAQLNAIVDQSLLPYTVEIGKTPLIFLSYGKR